MEVMVQEGGRCLPSRRQPHRLRRRELSSPLGIYFPGLTYTLEMDPKRSCFGRVSHGEFFWNKSFWVTIKNS